MLRQISDPNAFAGHTIPTVGIELSGKDPQQGCLARPVGAD